MWRTFLRSDLRIPLFTLACASTLGVALVAARTVLTWRGQHLYLVWNLFLAWIPLLLALRLEVMQQRGRSRDWRFWATAFAWLMFFPNAPYIFTDLTHLKMMTKAGWWTDLIVILLFAVTGLVLAFLSLHRMQGLVARRRGWLAGWAFVLAVAFVRRLRGLSGALRALEQLGCRDQSAGFVRGQFSLGPPALGQVHPALWPLPFHGLRAALFADLAGTGTTEAHSGQEG